MTDCTYINGGLILLSGLQFDLVCADAWLVDMYQATLNVGFLVGSIAIGYLADRYMHVWLHFILRPFLYELGNV